jgi:hypothetical protein
MPNVRTRVANSKNDSYIRRDALLGMFLWRDGSPTVILRRVFSLGMILRRVLFYEGYLNGLFCSTYEYYFLRIFHLDAITKIDNTLRFAWTLLDSGDKRAHTKGAFDL